MSAITGDGPERPFKRETDDAPETRTPPSMQVPPDRDSLPAEEYEFPTPPGPGDVLTAGHKDVKIQLAALFTLLAFALSFMGAKNITPEKLQNTYETVVALVSILGPLLASIPVLRKALTSRGKVESNTVNALASVQNATTVAGGPTSMVTSTPAGTSYSGDAALRYAYFAGQQSVSPVDGGGQSVRSLNFFDTGFGSSRDAASVDPPARMMTDLQIARGFESVGEQVKSLRATIETFTSSKSMWVGRDEIEAFARQLEQIETHVGTISSRLAEVERQGHFHESEFHPPTIGE